MHRVDLAAGRRVRLTATAHCDLAVHRWAVQILPAVRLAVDSGPRLAYGSQIGERDCDQRVDIPAQDIACLLDVRSAHASPDGWQDDQSCIYEDTDGWLVIGFSDPAAPQMRRDDVLLSFEFATAALRS